MSTYSKLNSAMAVGADVLSDTYVGYTQNDWVFDQGGSADRITIAGIAGGFTTLSGMPIYGFSLSQSTYDNTYSFSSVAPNSSVHSFSGIEVWEMASDVIGLNLASASPSGAYYLTPVTVNGNDQWNLILTTAWNDTINAGGGRDYIEPGIGNDTVNGGDGIDLVSYQNYSRYIYNLVTPSAVSNAIDAYQVTSAPTAPVSAFSYAITGVKVDLAAGTATAVAIDVRNAQQATVVINDSLTSIERAVGTQFNDVLVGDGNANLFEGFGGHDILVGGKNTETNMDLASFSGLSTRNGDGILVNMSTSDTVNNLVMFKSPTWMSMLTTYSSGSTSNDYKALSGSTTGTDTITRINYINAPSAPGVFYTAVATSDPYSQNPNNATTTIDQVLVNIEGVVGSGAHDILIGSDTANYFEGGAGDDVLFGNGGNDELVGDYMFRSATDNAGLLNPRGLNYTWGNDKIDGGAGDDTISGGFGSDQITGGAGNDILYGDYSDNQAAIATLETNAWSSGTDTRSEIYALNNSDYFFADAGDDKIYGGLGVDGVSYAEAAYLTDGANTKAAVALSGVYLNQLAITGTGGTPSVAPELPNYYFVNNGGNTGGVTADLVAGTVKANVTTGANTGSDTLDSIEVFTGSVYGDTVYADSRYVSIDAHDVVIKTALDPASGPVAVGTTSIDTINFSKITSQTGQAYANAQGVWVDVRAQTNTYGAYELDGGYGLTGGAYEGAAIKGFENYVGTALNDVFIVNAAINSGSTSSTTINSISIQTGDGEDYVAVKLSTGTLNNTLDTGDGADLVDVSLNGGKFATFTTGSGDDVVRSWGDTDTFINYLQNNPSAASSFAVNTLVGGAGTDTFFGSQSIYSNLWITNNAGVVTVYDTVYSAAANNNTGGYIKGNDALFVLKEFEYIGLGNQTGANQITVNGQLQSNYLLDLSKISATGGLLSSMSAAVVPNLYAYDPKNSSPIVDGDAITTSQNITALSTSSVTLDPFSPGGVNGASVADSAYPFALIGGSAADVLRGSWTNDALAGGAGNDTLIGGFGSDTVEYSNANFQAESPANRVAPTGAVSPYAVDTSATKSGTSTTGTPDLSVTTVGSTAGITVNLDYSSLTNGTSSSAITLTSATGTGSQGTDTLYGIENVDGTGGNDVITGSAVANQLAGMKGDDTLKGGGGDDQLMGGSGNDILDGGAGADSMFGGLGNDTFVVDNPFDVVKENSSHSVPLSDGMASFLAQADSASLGFNETGEANQFLSSGIDTIQTSLTTYSLIATSGAYVDQATGKAFTSSGWYLNNVTNQYVTNDGVVLGSTAPNLTSSYTVSQVNVNSQLYGWVENLSYTGSSNFVGYGNILNNVITSGAGNDTLDGGVGADTLSGGAGNDTYYADSAADLIVEKDASGKDVGGVDSVIASSSFVLAAKNNVENLTLAYAYNAANSTFLGVGNELANSISGGEQADRLYGGAGNDFMHGWGGNDTLRGGAGVDTLYGDMGDDYLYGGAGNDFLYGGEGKDTLNGGAGMDTMVGGAGSDTYIVTDASAVLVEDYYAGQGVFSSDSSGTKDVAYSTVDFDLSTKGANVEALALQGFAVKGTGNDLDNFVAGTLNDNVLSGLAGDDVLFGDSSFNDQFFEKERNALSTAGDFSSQGGDDILLGGDGNDGLIGQGGSDVLDGGAGADVMIGGAGSDTYYIDNVNDRIYEMVLTGYETKLAIRGAVDFGREYKPSDFLGHYYLDNTVSNSSQTSSNFAWPLHLDASQYAQWVAAGFALPVYHEPVDADNNSATPDVALSLQQLTALGLNDPTWTSVPVQGGTTMLLNGTGPATPQPGTTYLLYDTTDHLNPYYYLVTPPTSTAPSTFAAPRLDSGGDDWVYLSTNMHIGENYSVSLDQYAYNVENIKLVDGAAADFAMGTDGNNVILGNEFDNKLFGLAGNDTLSGGNGIDKLFGGYGDDVLDGGAGFDLAVYGSFGDTTLTKGINANLVTGLVTGWGGTDKLSNIEAVVGTSLDDVFLGDKNDNGFQGNGGNDTANGGDGKDVFVFAEKALVTTSQAVTYQVERPSDNFYFRNNGSDLLYQGHVYRLHTVNGPISQVLSATEYRGSDSGPYYGYGNYSTALDARDESVKGYIANFTSAAEFTAVTSALGLSASAQVVVNLKFDETSGSVVWAQGPEATSSPVSPSWAGNPLSAATASNVVTASVNGGNLILNGSHAADASGTWYYIEEFGGANSSVSRATGMTLDLTQKINVTGAVTYDSNGQVVSVDTSKATYAVLANATTEATAITLDLRQYGMGVDKFWNTEALGMTSLNDTFIGSTAADTIWGMDGNDILKGGAGNDVLYGGNQVEQQASDKTGVFFMSSGNDTLNGGVGDDTLDGGGGNDVADYSDAAFGVTVDFTQTTIKAPYTGVFVATAVSSSTAAGNSGKDVLINIETVWGSSGDDRFLLSSASQSVSGGSGGVDTVVTNFANYTLGSGTGTDVYANGYGIDNLETTYASGATLVGNSLDNVIKGAAGNDTLAGNLGNDTLDGGAGSDFAMFRTAAQAVVVDLKAGTAVGEGMDTLLNIENAIGSNYNDRLVGTDAANTLDGGLGDDVMAGGLGADTYLVDSLKDQVIELKEATVLDTVILTSTHTNNYVLASNVEVVKVGFASADYVSAWGSSSISNNVFDGTDDQFMHITGNSGNNTIYGGDGIDFLFGGGGTDTLIGGKGGDAYLYDGTGVTIKENANEGEDIVGAMASYTLGDNIEDAIAWADKNGYSPDIDLTGNALNNLLIGNFGSNVIKGLVGDDVIAGYGGDDLLYGGDGSDKFVWSQQGYEGVIADMNKAGVDKIMLAFNPSDSLSSTAHSMTYDLSHLSDTATNGGTQFTMNAGAQAAAAYEAQVIFNAATGYLQVDLPSWDQATMSWHARDGQADASVYVFKDFDAGTLLPSGLTQADFIIADDTFLDWTVHPTT